MSESIVFQPPLTLALNWRSPSSLVLCIGLPLVLLIGLADHATHGSLGLLQLEKALLWEIRSHAVPPMHVAARILSMLVTVVSIVGLVWLLYRRFWHAALFWLFGVAGAALFASLLKTAVQRSRPGLWTTVSSHATFSFPSGHATQSMAMALCLVILLRKQRQVRSIAALSGTTVLLVGACRMLLGHHFPTDVLAGWMLALVWVTVVAALLNDDFLQLHHRNSPESTLKILSN